MEKPKKGKPLILQDKKWIPNGHAKGVKLKAIDHTVNSPLSMIYKKTLLTDGGIPSDYQKLRKMKFPEVKAPLLEWFTLKRRANPTLSINDALPSL